jgi:putative ABC transport system substrate-binding protein
VKRFILPFGVLLAVSAILLLSDLQNRTSTVRDKNITRIAIFRYNSNQILEETEKGILNVILASDRFKNNQIQIKKYCAEGDLPTANTIARSIVSEKFDMVISISTPGLQVMANANKGGEVLHVFCAVTDPVVSGVGITGPGASQHPSWLVGIGTFQPVEEVFRIAREMNPDLRKVGVVWATSETCSEACVKKARIICKELGIELVETSVESVTQVFEAATSVCAKGVEALWIGGDNVVEPAISLLTAAGLKSRIPVLSNNPKHAMKGAMINLGANYYQVGQTAGQLAIDLINGLPPTGVEIKNVVPQRLFINDSVRKLMKVNWAFPDALIARCDSIIR